MSALLLALHTGLKSYTHFLIFLLERFRYIYIYTGGGSAAFSSLNTANPPPCLPSATNAPARQVPYSSLLK